MEVWKKAQEALGTIPWGIYSTQFIVRAVSSLNKEKGDALTLAEVAQTLEDIALICDAITAEDVELIIRLQESPKMNDETKSPYAKVAVLEAILGLYQVFKERFSSAGALDALEVMSELARDVKANL